MPAPTDRLPDVRSLIYEIERLRCAAMELREATIDVMNNASEGGAREERAAVARWLRAAHLHILADSIERGEHVKVVDE